MTARYDSVATLLVAMLQNAKIHPSFLTKSSHSFIPPRIQADTDIPNYGYAQSFSTPNCSTIKSIGKIVRKTIPGRPPKVSLRGCLV